MSMATLSKKDIEKSFSQTLKSLTEKEQDVIKRRIWLNWEKETLQNIWKSYTPDITRERVRQIENTWIWKIWRMLKSALLKNIQKIADDYINLHWWIIAFEKLINIAIKELNIDKNVNAWILDIVIQSTNKIKKSKPKFSVQVYFYKENINRTIIDTIHKEALKILKRKKDVMDKKSLYELIKTNLKLENNINTNVIFIDSALNLYEDIVVWEENLIWLSKWKILNPTTLKDKAVYIMKKEAIPMHFIDVANKISEMTWKTAKVNTIHNELIRNNEFVLVWRWIYGLKENWFTPWTIMDVIIHLLTKHWEPMTTEEITNWVLKHRKVRPTTIYMNIQNKNIIERVWRNYYQLKA